MITARPLIATSGAISTPSFIGPGCITIASGFASDTRSAFRPKRAAYSRSDGSRPPCMRSRWIRSAITTSASRTAASTSLVTWNRPWPGIAPPSQAVAQRSIPRRRVAGPHSQRSAPAAVSDQMLERATREWRMSPTIATLRPRRSPPGRCWRIVYRSSRACVGWACQPSPPFRTWPPKISAARYGAPETEWRITRISAPRASSVRIVSTSDSPLVTDEVAVATLTTSAERFRAAVSKETRVRVEAS